MSYVIWAINPDKKPSMAQLRQAFDAKDDNNTARMMARGYRAVVKDGVAILPISGPLYTSDYRYISAQVEMMEQDQEVASIILDINSPGGMVDGAIECASIISKSKKPVLAYVEGSGCSAAYLLASAASKIIATPSSSIGSIGVQGSWTNTEGLFAKLGIQKVYFHSKNAGKKNLSPGTEEGKASYIKLLDETWDLFAGAIAKNRNVDITTIIEKYGQGEVFLASEAKEKGLIDAIVDDFDACIEMIRPSIAGGTGEGMANEMITTLEALTNAYPTLVAQATENGRIAGVAEGAKAEQERSAGLLALSKYTDDLSVIEGAIKGNKTVAETQLAILEARVAEEKEEAEATVATLEDLVAEDKKKMVNAAPVAGDNGKPITAEEKNKAEIQAYLDAQKKEGGK